LSRTRWGFFGGEAVRSLRNNLATTLAATVTVLIVMYLLGVGVWLGSYVYNSTQAVKQDLTIKVFLDDKATEAQTLAIRRTLVADPRVDAPSVTYVSKDDAYLRMKKQMGKDAPILKFVPPGTFPASWEAKAKDANDLPAIAASLRGVKGLDRDPSQENPNYGGQTSDRALKVIGAIGAVIAVVAVVLALAAVLLIGNTIRLSIFARRREVEVMKLVGATNWFVRWPFMLEGILCGTLGAAAAILMLLVTRAVLPDIVTSDDGFLASSAPTIDPGLLSLVILAAGFALGALGSGLTMRKFLRV
jgi:cell division transport system permease protein